ncbi:hypothetical protein [Deinococcus cellulosilyticus]|uniref:Uncharacterized protein n=1 Tax=Deinococcus cellulosilyticus (strain DSM 18568 / NBRC 106333 / KACC 11606 / 5516J-15) TaxID=1223518 RepID=A0A511N755_DEIC1|nr:hypothetical protein [Deinococcus cellulosilyticus]GEM48317.1 hypothetical protein DC3_39520 [Deinococcus cellulosilyticus NBRC 106333 = KACC 11606]
MPYLSCPLTLQDLPEQLKETCKLLEGEYSCVKHAVLVHQLRDMYQLVKPHTLDQDGQPFECLPSHVILEQQWHAGKETARETLRELQEIARCLADDPNKVEYNPLALRLIQVLRLL